MKKVTFTLFTFIFALFVFTNTAIAQIQDCSEPMGDPLYCDMTTAATPTFTLSMVANNIDNSGPGGTTVGATLSVFFTNNSAMDLDLVTISFSMGINSTNVSSLINPPAGCNSPVGAGTTGVESFPGIWQQCTVFFPDQILVLDAIQTMSSAKTFNGNTYDQEYIYNHTGSGASHPPQTIAAGARVEVMQMTWAFDGTQTFQITDKNAADFLVRPENFFIFLGECLDPDQNINNQWGFENQFGQQLLLNCFNSRTQPGLPIELVDFSGEVFDRYNELYWSTLTEINTKWHIIESTPDPQNVDFKEVGRVPAAGSSSDVLTYSLQDFEPFAATYYRLKTEDFDGSVQYSEVILLKRPTNGMSDVYIYPNPTFSDVTLELEVAPNTTLKIEVVDVIGRVLASEEYNDLNGIVKRQIDLSYYAAGIYFVHIKDGVNLHVEKIVKHQP